MHTARIKWVGQEQFLAQPQSGHLIPIDSDRNSNGAPGPMELLLVALGSCTATDVVAILAKKRQDLQGLEIEVAGERAADPPMIWTRLEIVYKLRGNLDEEAVKHTIQLSEEKYCSVAAMLRRSAPITFRYEIQRP
jgi:putative redox protein